MLGGKQQTKTPPYVPQWANTYIHTSKCTVYTPTPTHRQTNIYAHMDIHRKTYIHAERQIYRHTNTCIYSYTEIQNIDISAHTHTHHILFLMDRNAK